jgi:hypothetical protein
MTESKEVERIRLLLDDAAAGETTGDFDAVYRRALRQRVAWRGGLATALAAVVAAAVVVPSVVLSHGSSSPTVRVLRGGGGPSESTAPGDLDPVQLVGSWRVSAAGEPDGTSLILGGGDLRVFRACGMLDGVWTASRSGLFVGYPYGGDGTCFLGARKDPDVPWLTAAKRYRIDGDERLLLDASGNVVARLSPGAHPTVGPNDVPSFAAPPVVNAKLRAMFDPPAPLPASLRPASLDDMLGRWHALGPKAGNSKAYVAFRADGTWTGSDGCNGIGGRFAVGPAGELLVTQGGQTLVGCGNSPVSSWVGTAGRVGLDGPDLVLVDERGEELGRLGKG